MYVYISSISADADEKERNLINKYARVSTLIHVCVRIVYPFILNNNIISIFIWILYIYIYNFKRPESRLYNNNNYNCDNLNW